MNWSDVGSKIAQYAPIAGAALSSPFGAVTAVGSLIASAFGVKSTPEDVADFFDNDPVSASERINSEIAGNIDLQRLINEVTSERNRHFESVISLQNQEMADARKNLPVVSQSPVDNVIRLILVISQVSILSACVFIMAKFGKVLDQSIVLALGTVMGSMGTMLGNKDNFYWGTSTSVK